MHRKQLVVPQQQVGQMGVYELRAIQFEQSNKESTLTKSFEVLYRQQMMAEQRQMQEQLAKV
jgi:hypothetical protein